MADSLPGKRSDARPGRATTGETAPFVGLALGAGAGTRLAPLTRWRPKVLCPVLDVALVDLAVDRLARVCPEVAVNIHHGRDALEQHFRDRPVDGRPPLPSTVEMGRGGALGDVAVRLSVEEPVALGTAGAVARLRPWIDGRGALVVNGDTWSTAGLAGFVRGWDGERVRLLLHGVSELRAGAGVVASLLPWSRIVDLAEEPSGLYGRCWKPAAADGALEVVRNDADFADCGTPADYVEANLRAASLVAGGRSWIGDGAEVRGRVEGSVVGAGARVAGSLEESVVWPGAEVAPGERLRRAIRTELGTTVLVR